MNRYRSIGIVGLALVLMAAPSWAAIAVPLQRMPSGRYVMQAQMLTDVVAVANGEWIAMDGVRPFSVQVTGITTATVQVRGSNAPTKPADNTHGFQLGSNLTADGVVAVETPVRWVKVQVTVWTSGTLNAYLVGEMGP